MSMSLRRPYATACVVAAVALVAAACAPTDSSWPFQRRGAPASGESPAGPTPPEPTIGPNLSGIPRDAKVSEIVRPDLNVVASKLAESLAEGNTEVVHLIQLKTAEITGCHVRVVHLTVDPTDRSAVASEKRSRRRLLRSVREVEEEAAHAMAASRTVPDEVVHVITGMTCRQADS